MYELVCIFSFKFPSQFYQTLKEKDFGRIQIDRVVDMYKWADDIKTIEDERIRLAIVAANNHYSVFGPGTVNVFRNMRGSIEISRKQF